MMLFVLKAQTKMSSLCSETKYNYGTVLTDLGSIYYVICDCSGYSVDLITCPVRKTKEYNIHICEDQPALKRGRFP